MFVKEKKVLKVGDEIQMQFHKLRITGMQPTYEKNKRRGWIAVEPVLPEPVPPEPLPAAGTPIPVGKTSSAGREPVPSLAKEPVAVASGAWIVQLGSFSRRENAERLATEVKGKGFTVSVLGGGGASGTLFRVRAGPAADRATAEALAAGLAAAGFKGGRASRQ